MLSLGVQQHGSSKTTVPRALQWGDCRVLNTELEAERPVPLVRTSKTRVGTGFHAGGLCLFVSRLSGWLSGVCCSN